MKAWASSRWCAVLILAALAGCAKQDGNTILGKWHAERLDLMGLKLPIGPDLTISRDKLSMEGTEMPITAIEQDGDEIVLDTMGGIGLTFHVVDADRIYVQFPFVDKIYYRRVKTAEPAMPAPDQTPPGVAAAVTVPAAVPVAAAQRPPAPAYMAAYDAAVQAARQGQRDAALRYLHEAAQQGFNRSDILEQEADFEPLRSDPRYQVIVLNLKP